MCFFHPQKRASPAHHSVTAAARKSRLLQPDRLATRYQLQDLEWIAQNDIQADFQVHQESLIQLK